LGSRKGHGVSEATRQKIRDKLKGRKISEEARRKRIGRKLSPEHRRNIGLASKGKKHSEKTKRKMRGRKHTDESRRKMSEARKGKKNPMYGKRLSEEHRRKIGRKGKLNKNYGKRLSKEHRKNIGLAQKGKKYAPGRIPGMKGKKHSEATKKKIGRKGKLNKNYGKRLSEKTKRKISEARKGKPAWNKNKTGIYSEEARRRMSEAHKGQKAWSRGLTKETDGRVRKISETRMGMKFSEESKRNMSTARKKLFASGYVPHNKGKKAKPESRRNMSLAQKRRFASGAQPPMKGKKHTEEARRRMSKSTSGVNHPNYGKHLPKKTKKRIGAKNKITAKRHWESMTKSQKQKSALAKNWFVKGQAPHNKGKKPKLKTRKRMSASATLRFQTQKHPMDGKRHDKATRKLIREKRLEQKPMKNTVPEKLMRKMLKDLGIRFEEQIGIKEPACQPDFFIQPNILIFTDGDRIHTNPNPHLIPSRSKKIYPGYKDDYKLFRNITAKDMWARDRRITRGLKKEGYKVLRFWHSELETEKEKCLQKILKAIK